MVNDHTTMSNDINQKRAANLFIKLPYWDIWETQATTLSEQYYTYYIYIWEHWHEMEERLIWIASIRAVFLGI